MKVIRFLFDLFGWLIIVFGVTVGSGLIALLIYTNWSTASGETVSIVIILVGFILGAAWATKIWKKHGTIEWLSSIRKVS